MEAALAGRRRLLSEERMALLRYFVDGDDPELHPMWVVFDSFAVDFSRDREIHPRVSLIVCAP